MISYLDTSVNFDLWVLNGKSFKQVIEELCWSKFGTTNVKFNFNFKTTCIVILFVTIKNEFNLRSSKFKNCIVSKPFSVR